MPRALALLPIAFPLLLCTCGGDSPADAGAWPTFTIRGRWDAPMQLTYRIDADGAPIDAPVFHRAVERAIGAWRATGTINLTAAPADSSVDVTLAFRRGHHGACEPFGPSTAVAHSGPVATGTFVHFDAARSWGEDTLFRTALHELGHVLGLGHSLRPDAVMSTGDVVPDHLGQPDRDGLHSLYGGGDDRPGDLRVVSGDGRTAAVLRGIAPANTDRATFDVDGDGRDDLLVWRTEAAGNGALMIYHFAPDPTARAPRLQATLGPFLGITVPGMEVLFARTASGERLLLGARPNGRVTALAFAAHGVPTPRETTESPADLLALARAQLRTDGTADLDGDGARETIVAIGR